jgi:hypothetical protein
MHRSSLAIKAVAIKKGQAKEPVPKFMQMGTLRCNGCGEEFIAFHHPESVDKSAVERQAHWLEKVLDEEHVSERRHPDRIQLPD